MKASINGIDYMRLALAAFGGLCLEVVVPYNCEMQLLHWTITCIVWGVVAWYIVKSAKKNYNFNIFEKSKPIQLWQWATSIGCVAIYLINTYVNWGERLGVLKFIFQYMYYLFEVVLFMLIIVFGQKAFEVWLKKTSIPYGGVIVALTWGMMHWLTKSSLTTGLYSAFHGFCFGTVYLLLNRRIKWTYIASCIMFIL